VGPKAGQKPTPAEVQRREAEAEIRKVREEYEAEMRSIALEQKAAGEEFARIQENAKTLLSLAINAQDDKRVYEQASSGLERLNKLINSRQIEDFEAGEQARNTLSSALDLIKLKPSDRREPAGLPRHIYKVEQTEKLKALVTGKDQALVLVPFALGERPEAVWCLASAVRDALLAQGVAAQNVVVAADARPRSDLPGRYQVPLLGKTPIVEVAEAPRHLKVTKTDRLCARATNSYAAVHLNQDPGYYQAANDGQERLESVDWLNPVILKQEHDALVAEAPKLLASMKESIAAKDFPRANEILQQLLPVAEELAAVADLTEELTDAMAKDQEIREAKSERQEAVAPITGYVESISPHYANREVLRALGGSHWAGFASLRKKWAIVGCLEYRKVLKALGPKRLRQGLLEYCDDSYPQESTLGLPGEIDQVTPAHCRAVLADLPCWR